MPDGTNVGWLVAGVALLVLGVVALGLRRSLAGWWRRLWETRRRVLAEDALKHIHTTNLGNRPVSPDSLAAALRISPRATATLIENLQAQGWLRSGGDNLSLSADGARLAVQVIRAHRLWERYLVDEARMPLSDVHAEAERREHARTPEELDALEAAMGYPRTDPHGDPIPTAGGELEEPAAQAVTDWPLDTLARIVHLEDEPPAIFAQIAAEGLRPGQTIRVIEADAKRVVLSSEEDTHVLAPVVAANIFVTSVDKEDEHAPCPRLTSLKLGQRATVRELDETLRGFTRRRLLDLGLTPGVTVTAEMTGIFRDPVAYRVRGTLIALRREQARYVLIDVNSKGKTGDG